MGALRGATEVNVIEIAITKRLKQLATPVDSVTVARKYKIRQVSGDGRILEEKSA
jgi:hypothetical protein